MQPKEAVILAKKHIADLFSEEGAKNLGLEEIEFDGASDTWSITIGFSRPWDEPRNALAALAGEGLLKRAYKIVKLNDDDGRVLSVRTHKVSA